MGAGWLVDSALVIGALMFLTWIVSVVLRNASIVDLIWGLGFVLIAWTMSIGEFGVAADVSSPKVWAELGRPSFWLLLLLTTIWGLRLSVYLAWRNHGLPEDKRYAAMRKGREQSFWWQSLFIVFLLQGAVMWIVSLPLQAGMVNAQPGWTVLHLIGFVLWSVGLFFGAVGDWQLARFKTDPSNQGRVLDQGLWRYTRHPNYFGDFCIWWGFYLIAIAHGRNLWTILGPASMSVFLMKVSGVTLLEKSLTAEKPAYADYICRTNAFFPGPPRRSGPE